jgi:3-phenylpropionate/trans-cinnamate dioxygenase ferredoxin reductase subunit
VLIVGAGQAGFQVAVSLRQKRFEGSILILGDEPYPPYQRPPLSKAALKDGLNEAALWFRPEAFYDTQKIDLRRGVRVSRIDRAAKAVSVDGGSTVGYGELVLATGARARPLPMDLDVPEGTLFTLRTLDDAHALRPRLGPGVHVAVIGAGYIGLEVAASARQLGAEVAVIDQAPRVMQRTVSPTISAYFQTLHAGHGVHIQLADTVRGATLGGDRPVLICGSDIRLPFDILVVGIGVIANDDLARDAGLAVQDGILADAQGRTDDAHIFAAGDCARHVHTGYGEPVRFESVQSAIDQGKVVAAAIMGESDQHSAVPWFWSDQYDAKLQVVGIPEADCATFIRGEPSSGSFAVYHMRGETPVAVEAVNSPQDFVAARKSVGYAAPARCAGA